MADPSALPATAPPVDRLTLIQSSLNELAFLFSQGIGKLQRDAGPVPLAGLELVSGSETATAKQAVVQGVATDLARQIAAAARTVDALVAALPRQPTSTNDAELLALEEANAAEIARLERLVAAGQQRLREIRAALDMVTADLQAVAAERTAMEL